MDATTHRETLLSVFTLAEMSEEDIERWQLVIRLCAKYGEVNLTRIGKKWARRFIDLGLLYFVGTRGFLTSLGEDCEV